MDNAHAATKLKEAIGPRTHAGGRRTQDRMPGGAALLASWLSPERFEYVPIRRDRAALNLSAHLAEEAAEVLYPRLVVRQLLTRTVHRHVGSVLEERTESGLLWVIRFEVPLQIVEGPRSVFTLSAPGRPPVPLPTPSLDPSVAAALAESSEGRLIKARARRCLVAISAGVAVATSSGVMATSAAADTAPTTTTTATTATPPSAPTTTPASSTTTTAGSPGTTGAPTTSTATTSATPASGAPASSSTPTSTHAPASKPASPTHQNFKASKTTHGDKPSPAAPNAATHETSSHTTRHPHSRHTASLGTALTITRTSTTGTKRPLACRKLILALKRLDTKKQLKQLWHEGAKSCLTATDHKHAKKNHKHAKKDHGQGGGLIHSRTHQHPVSFLAHQPVHGADHPLHAHHQLHNHHPLVRHVSGGAHLPAAQKLKPHVITPTSGQPGALVPTTIWNGGFNIDPFTAQQVERFTTVTASLDQPPGFLIPIYKAAGRRFHIPWQILAAINAIETNYGQNLSISPAGAMGWMQFMPGTWSEFGLSAAGDRQPNPYDPRDAIFSAARYRDANGGAQHIRQALFGYNHAWWYVDAVLWRAQLISDTALGKRARENGYALPLDLRYMMDLGRTDEGVDIEDAPNGIAVYSMTPGIVTAVASDPGGFGPNYPVVLVTKGPLAGQYIYYGHVAASLVKVGQHVLAGQPIAVMGHTGNAASLGHGHIEIGFSDASGDPLNHGGLAAWTPSGDAMRRVLVALTHVYLVKAHALAARRPTRSSRPSYIEFQDAFTVAWPLLRPKAL